MNPTIIQEILPFVELPSRYLGSEINSIRKDLSGMALTVALAFPDLYEIGTSHFGMQILYTVLNQQPDIAAERFFAPAPDMEFQLKSKGAPLFSLESKKDLKTFDIIGFSLLYELNFTNILTMLDLAGIPFFAADRPDTLPLVIGGGPCAFNPEPMADFFDAFVVGDGEDTILEISRAVIAWKSGGDGKKSTLLRQLSAIQGVYVPSFFTPRYDSAGIQTLEPVFSDYTRVRRSILPDLAGAPLPSAPVVPFGKPVHDRLRLEIARGCSRGCRFCQAGMIYRPVREQSVPDLVSLAETAVKNTGYSDVSLLSLSTGDYGSLPQLMEHLLGVSPHHCTALSLPSIRAGRLTPELMRIIRKVKKTGFTIAPEAGSQRLRDAINKNISEQEIVDTVTSAFALGWRTIKLYFMNGLPTETQDDIQAIIDLSRMLAAIPVQGKGKSKISVSFAPFIPKPHTPFQRCPQISTREATENLNFLKQNMRHPGINLKWHNPEMSLLEGVWSRGDRRLSKLLVAAWENGCRLDGWTDMFRYDRWQDAFDKTGIDPLFYTERRRDRDEPLPWDHIDPGVTREFLEAEYDRSLTLETTPDCRENGCTGCGICDFKTIAPVLHKPVDMPEPEPFPRGETRDINYTRFRVLYTRLGNARHFGHLELAKVIRRAIRKTGIRVKYSGGFSPAMKVSFDNPLPIGMESEEEFFTLHADVATRPALVVEALNKALPGIITVTACIPHALVKNKTPSETVAYRISLLHHTVAPDAASAFMASDEFLVEQTSHKGQVRKMDLRKAVREIVLLDSKTIEMVLNKVGDRTIRPAEILTRVLSIPVDDVRTAAILKLKQDTRPC